MVFTMAVQFFYTESSFPNFDGLNLTDPCPPLQSLESIVCLGKQDMHSDLFVCVDGLHPSQ